jgi:hypothetical protein
VSELLKRTAKPEVYGQAANASQSVMAVDGELGVSWALIRPSKISSPLSMPQPRGPRLVSRLKDRMTMFPSSETPLKRVLRMSQDRCWS